MADRRSIEGMWLRQAFFRWLIPAAFLLPLWLLIGWIVTPDYVIDEIQRGGRNFRRKKLYRVMIRYIAPVMMLVLFLQSTGILR